MNPSFKESILWGLLVLCLTGIVAMMVTGCGNSNAQNPTAPSQPAQPPLRFSLDGSPVAVINPGTITVTPPEASLASNSGPESGWVVYFYRLNRNYPSPDTTTLISTVTGYSEEAMVDATVVSSANYTYYFEVVDPVSDVTVYSLPVLVTAE